MKIATLFAILTVFSASLLFSEDKEKGTEGKARFERARSDRAEHGPKRGHEGADRPGKGGERSRLPGPQSDDRLFDTILNNPELARKIGVSEEQVETIHNQRKASQKEMGALRGKMEKAGRRQAELMMSKEVDEEALMKAVEETGAIHTKMAKLRMKNLLQTRKSLTPEQRTKIREVMKEKMANRSKRMEEMREMMHKRGEGADRERQSPEEMRRRREEYRKKRDSGQKPAGGDENE